MRCIEHFTMSGVFISHLTTMPLFLLKIRALFRSFERALMTNTTTESHRLLPSNIQILDIERILLDKIPTWLYIVSHQGSKDIIGSNRIFNGYL